MLGLTKIKTPQRLVSPKLTEGDKVVVHKIEKSHIFYQVVFNNLDSNTGFEIITENSADITHEIKECYRDFVDKVLEEKNIYAHYSYLFVHKSGKGSELLSITLDDISLGYTLVDIVAEELSVPCVKPIWRGVFTMLNIAAFYEDIFIQKL